MPEVNNTASLLKVTRYPGETEDTFRTRVAYAMQARLMREEGQEPSARILERMENWELKAKAEKEEQHEPAGSI